MMPVLGEVGPKGCPLPLPQEKFLVLGEWTSDAKWCYHELLLYKNSSFEA